jgi:23S rRNA (pseudouridine1915-N3)-methyltransferase
LKLRILAIGRLKAGPEKEMAEDYLERIDAIGRKAGITKIEVADCAESVREQEGDWLLAKCPKDSFKIALDEHGKSMGSAAFAALLRKTIDSGVPGISFLIGGPDGHSAKLLEAADLRLCFGAMTWPHRLVRIMLAEQIYRAVTIMVNHPYHRP